MSIRNSALSIPEPWTKQGEYQKNLASKYLNFLLVRKFFEKGDKKNDRRMMEFLSVIAHEMATPVSAILGFSELLEDENEKEFHKEYKDIIKYNSKLLLSIFDDYLGYSYVKTGKLKANFTAFSLSRIVTNTRRYSKMLIAMNMKNIEYMESIEEIVGQYIISDMAKIQQIINNLINNAVKFTDNGFIEFGVRLKSINKLEFFVRDTGEGISKIYQKRVFDKFERGAKAKNENKCGKGLGLFISRELASLLGGGICVRSPLPDVDRKNGWEKAGTEFAFTIPYKSN